MAFYAVLALAAVGLILLVSFVSGRRADHKFEHFSNFTQGAFHLAGFIGIVVTGLWFLFQTEWAPRASVDLKPTVHLIGEQPSQVALLQVALNVSNVGKTRQEFTFIRMSVQGYAPNALPNRFGDLAAVPLGSATLPFPIILNPGETDTAYAEFKIDCSQTLVQVLTKIAEPEHWTKDPSLRLAYERKAVVPIHAACEGVEGTEKQT